MAHIVRNPALQIKTAVFSSTIWQKYSYPAISALRYFYEDMPELHVIATGSLLEFVFTKIKDFGVGRIRNSFIYPFSFTEFAYAVGDEILIEHLREATFSNPLSEIDHSMLLKLLKTYIIFSQINLWGSVRICGHTKPSRAASTITERIKKKNNPDT